MMQPGMTDPEMEMDNMEPIMADDQSGHERPREYEQSEP